MVLTAWDILNAISGEKGPELCVDGFVTNRHRQCRRVMDGWMGWTAAMDVYTCIQLSKLSRRDT